MLPLCFQEIGIRFFERECKPHFETLVFLNIFERGLWVLISYQEMVFRTFITPELVCYIWWHPGEGVTAWYQSGDMILGIFPHAWTLSLCEIFVIWLKIFAYVCRVMVRRNLRRERPADQDSAEASHTLHRSNVREHWPPPPVNRQEMNIPPPAPRERRFEKLRKLGATSFSGTLDLAEAESWLESTEWGFDLMYCTPEEKFDYAVFLLQGDAYSWWKTVPHSRVQPPVLTWEDFLREFNEKYAPAVYKREKQREFIELKQGSISVAEYGLKFT